MTTAKTLTSQVELLSDQLNLGFLTLIEHQGSPCLTIVENIIKGEIHAYVLDRLEAEGVDQTWFMRVATLWFYKGSHSYPLSFEFSLLGAGNTVAPLIKVFQLDQVSRLVGKPFAYEPLQKAKIKKRKRPVVKPLTEINLKRR